MPNGDFPRINTSEAKSRANLKQSAAHYTVVPGKKFNKNVKNTEYSISSL
jgi:hypothetical protein